MKTALPAGFLATERGAEANRILRSCVHCGLCNATCPTYQVEANELDGPRGRIYLIKSMLEEAEVTPVTRLHLDRCLTCRACETTCPSGVDYHSLLDIGREEIDQRQPRPWWQRCWRRLLLAFFSRRKLFSAVLRLGRMLRPLAPRAFAHYLTPERGAGWSSPATDSPRKVILVQGCVQPGLSPSTNRAAAHVMAHLDIGAIEAAGGTVLRRHGLAYGRNGAGAGSGPGQYRRLAAASGERCGSHRDDRFRLQFVRAGLCPVAAK